MNPKLAQELKDTLKFLYLYNQSAAIRESVNQIIITTPNINKVLIELPGLPKRPLMRYLGNLAGYSSNFGKYSQYFFRTYRKSPTSITDNLHTFLDACYRDAKAIEEFRAIPDQYIKDGSTGEKSGQDRTFQPLTRRLQRSFNQTVERMGVTDQDRKFENYRIWEKLYKYGDELKTREGRDKLIKAKLLSKEEVSFLLIQGLIPFADKVSDKHNFNRFIKRDEKSGEAVVDEELWRKAVAAAAGRSIEEKIKSGVWKVYKQAAEKDRKQLSVKIEFLKKITNGQTFSSLQELRDYLTAINLLGNYKFNQWEINAILASGLIPDVFFSPQTIKKLSLPKINIPSKLKDLASLASLKSQSALRHLTLLNLVKFLPSILLGAAGFGVAGIPGAVAGAVAGRVLPSLVGQNFHKAVSSLNNGTGSLSSKSLSIINNPFGPSSTMSKLMTRTVVGSLSGLALITLVIVFILSGANVTDIRLPTDKFTLPSYTLSTPTPGPPAPPKPSPGAIPPNQGSLDYFIPFRDSSIQISDPGEVKARILNSWPNAQIQYWDYIVSRSIENNWNPAFVLTLWVEESGAQGVSNYTDPLGCDPSHPTTAIDSSLNCLFASFSHLENSRFEDFMCTYSESHNAPCIFNTNPNFPGNIKSWYSILAPSTLTNVQSSPPNVSLITNIINGITQAAAQITSSLLSIRDRYFNFLQSEPDVFYWCTYLVIDAYNKAGLAGLDRSQHGAVLNMKSFFATTPGYSLLPPKADVTQLKPGDVVFFEGSGAGSQHVSLVKSIEIDENGNGVIHTYDANNIVTEDIITVAGYQAISAQTTSRIYSITGFGQTATI